MACRPTTSLTRLDSWVAGKRPRPRHRGRTAARLGVRHALEAVVCGQQPPDVLAPALDGATCIPGDDGRRDHLDSQRPAGTRAGRAGGPGLARPREAQCRAATPVRERTNATCSLSTTARPAPPGGARWHKTAARPLETRQIRTLWCPAGRHNHASSRAIGAGTDVLIVSPESWSRARRDVVNKPWVRSAGASGYPPPVSWAYLRTRRE